MTKKSNRKRKRYANKKHRKQLTIPQQGSMVVSSGITPAACCAPIIPFDSKLDCVQDDELVHFSDTKENDQTDANSLNNSPVSTTSSGHANSKLSNMSPVATISHVLALTPSRTPTGLFDGSVDLSDEIVQTHDSMPIIGLRPSSSVSSSCDISVPHRTVMPVSLDLDDDGVSSTTPNLEVMSKKKRQKRKRNRKRQQVILVNPPETKQDETNCIAYNGSYHVTNVGNERRSSNADESWSRPTSLPDGNATTAHVEETLDMVTEADGKSDSKPLDFRESNGGHLMAEYVETEVCRELKPDSDETDETCKEVVEEKKPPPSTFEELMLMHFHQEVNVAELVESMNCLEQDNKAHEEHLATLMNQVNLLTSEKQELERAFTQ